jgi:5'-nucleotidase
MRTSSFGRRAATAALALAASTTVAVATAGAAPAANAPLRILVTNDDGVGADGINALVQALRGVEGVQVTVIAPADDKSGTGATTTKGPLTATPTTTKSGFPATAVQGFPADTVIYALQHLDQKPDLVMSGINAGANLGAIINGSGTFGAAKTAAQRGLPAVAMSQGDTDVTPDYTSGAAAALAWLAQHRSALTPKAGRKAPVVLDNVNIPTCATGTIRGTVHTRNAPTAAGAIGAVSNCASTLTRPKNDIVAFTNGFISVAKVPVSKR